MIIHLVSSSKGGMGKTSFCITISLYYLTRGKKCILYDANTNNIDFFTIMRETDYKSVKEKDTLIDGIYYSSLKRNQEDSFACLKKDPLKIYKGIIDFWKNIKKVKTRAEKEGIDVIIIDTNLTLYNFLDDIDENDIKKILLDIFETSNKLNKISLYIWYIWNMNDFQNIKRKSIEDIDLSDIMNKIENYTAYSKKDPDGNIIKDNNGLEIKDYYIKQKENLIHIINPYLFWYEKARLLQFFKVFFSKNEAIFLDLIKAGTKGVGIDGVRLDELLQYIGLALEVALNLSDQIKNTTTQSSKKKLELLNKSNLNLLVLKTEKDKINYLKEQIEKISRKNDEQFANSDFKAMYNGCLFKEELEEKLSLIVTNKK